MGGTLRRVDEKASCAEYSTKAYIVRGNTAGYVLGGCMMPLLYAIFLLPISIYPTDIRLIYKAVTPYSVLLVYYIVV